MPAHAQCRRVRNTTTLHIRCDEAFLAKSTICRPMRGSEIGPHLCIWSWRATDGRLIVKREISADATDLSSAPQLLTSPRRHKRPLAWSKLADERSERLAESIYELRKQADWNPCQVVTGSRPEASRRMASQVVRQRQLDHMQTRKCIGLAWWTGAKLSLACLPAPRASP
jgi:hypothetical protein